MNRIYPKISWTLWWLSNLGVFETNSSPWWCQKINSNCNSFIPSTNGRRWR